MPGTWWQLVQRGLLALTLATLVAVLLTVGRRRMLAVEERTRARNGLLIELLANVSEGLDRLEAGLDDISARAAHAKSRLVAARSQRQLACALLAEKRLKEDRSHEAKRVPDS